MGKTKEPTKLELAEKKFEKTLQETTTQFFESCEYNTNKGNLIMSIINKLIGFFKDNKTEEIYKREIAKQMLKMSTAETAKYLYEAHLHQVEQQELKKIQAKITEMDIAGEKAIKIDLDSPVSSFYNPRKITYKEAMKALNPDDTKPNNYNYWEHLRRILIMGRTDKPVKSKTTINKSYRDLKEKIWLWLPEADDIYLNVEVENGRFSLIYPKNAYR